MKRTDFELLLPVGQKEMALAAIHNGADAIFLGFPGFNARGRSYDFELAELEDIIRECHLYGVKVNLAFNIVIFENEFEKVINSIEKVLPLKPDALIVQDLGLVRLIKEMCPDQTIHASTQMTITNDLAISLLDDLKIKRFVLGRENSLSEIKLIAQRTQKELEVFVHGALCVSYSGQCFTSETLGGRSANRGQCAQSCRFNYDLIVDGEKRNLIDRNYLVSPQDLCGISEISQLMSLGVKSFKVEGRLKSPEYVAQVAKSYRQVIDKTISQKTIAASDLEVEKRKMAVEYSRGFFSGWLNGVDHQRLVDGTFSSHRGLEIGHIVDVQDNSIKIKVNHKDIEIENGDGLLWFEGANKVGGSIYSISKKNDLMTIEFANALRLQDQAVGSKIYLNHDRSQKKEIEKSIQDRNFKKRIPITVSISAEIQKPLEVCISDGKFEVQLRSDSNVVEAQKKPLTDELLFEEFNSVSHTVFSLSHSDFKTNLNDCNGVFLNHKEIKNIRQKAYQRLSELRSSNKIDSIQDAQLFPAVTKSDFPTSPASSLKLNILLRNKDQVRYLVEAINAGEFQTSDISTVCLDFEFGRDYRGSVESLKSSGIKVGIATTRILKPQEYINLKIIHSLQPNFILVRNLGALYYYQNVQKFEGDLKGDFSLNVTNHKTFEYLIEKGLSSICLSYDMNFEQSVSLLQKIEAQKAEMTIHQSMPSFHMEHCVFAAFLSQGSSYKDCGKPCEKHKVQLKDQFGNYHWIKPDQECRNTMYNASAQTALPYLSDWKSYGLGEIRFEALHEEGADLISKIKNYIQVIKGEKSVEQALSDLKAVESYGLSPRQLARSQEYQSRKKDHSFL